MYWFIYFYGYLFGYRAIAQQITFYITDMSDSDVMLRSRLRSRGTMFFVVLMMGTTKRISCYHEGSTQLQQLQLQIYI